LLLRSKRNTESEQKTFIFFIAKLIHGLRTFTKHNAGLLHRIEFFGKVFGNKMTVADAQK